MGYVAGVVARGHYGANVDGDQGAGWETELCAQIRGSALPTDFRLRPNCASPHARCVAPIRDTRIGHDVCTCRSAVAWGCPATHLRVRLSLWYRPHRYIPHSANARAQRGLLRGGAGVDERGEGRCLLRARPSRLRRLHTIIDAAASCIGGIAERSVPRRRARWPAQCGAVDGETYVETGGNVGGQGSVLLLRIQLRGAWGSCGVECTAAVREAMCLRATERGAGAYGSVTVGDATVRAADVRGGKRALSRTVGMPVWGDVWATSDAPGETSRVGGMEESRAAGRGLSSSSWKRWREADPGESREWDSTI
ncbi:hypothetical protein B0H14DRAFT_3158978 [Mycena olivaceomarginata]|nr:hypothetical protein B0H14DRAFT_3158978 [Mycena olivaceomarginata]